MDDRFDLAESRLLLANTPRVLDALLRDLPDAWLDATEGGESWSPRIVLGHLIVGEESDWISRARHILGHDSAVAFPPFDRFAQFRRPRVPITDDLAAFARARAASLDALAALRLTEADLDRRGVHPEFGPVTLRQHLATWTAHDLSHLAQIARVLARRHAKAVGPWRAYLPIVQVPPRAP
jgi:hypothetical protein